MRTPEAIQKDIDAINTELSRIRALRTVRTRAFTIATLRQAPVPSVVLCLDAPIPVHDYQNEV